MVFFLLAYNGWVYEQVCLVETIKLTDNVSGKLAYIPCCALGLFDFKSIHEIFIFYFM